MKKDIHTHEHLLNVGFEMFLEDGSRNITVRKLAQRANVNSGVFSYHFGSRENYLTELLERWYAPMFNSVQMTMGSNLPPLEGLRAIILEVLDYVAKYGKLIAHLFLDAKSGEQAARKFANNVPLRHPRVILQAIKRAQDAGCIIQEDPVRLLLYLVSVTEAPMIMQHMIHGATDLPPAMMQDVRVILDDPTSAAQRLDWALKGITV